MRTIELALGMLFIAAVAVAPGIQAQSRPIASQDEVIGYSYIMPGNGPTVTAFVGTELGADVSIYYDCSLNATLSGPSGSTGTSDGPCEGTLSLASGGGTFTVTSDHYLIPVRSDDEDGNYFDPLGFAGVAPTFGASEIDAYPATDYNPYYEVPEAYFYLGQTTYQQSAVAPVIQGISTAAGDMLTLGSSGTLQIVGAWLTADGTDPNPHVAVTSGSGLTLYGVSVINDGQLNVDYAIDSNPSSTGNHGIQVTTVAGPSNSYNVFVGDPTPAISSLSPNAWNAGVTTTFVVSGNGFGTDRPSVSISGAGISNSNCTQPGTASGTCGVSSYGDTSISVIVTPDPNTPGGSATVTVTSNGYNGYNGNNFQSAQSGQAQSASQSASVIPIAAPQPVIVAGQGLAACQAPTQVPSTVVVGQQIAFTACIPSAVSAQVRDEAWTPSLPTVRGIAVGGYNVTYAPGTTNATAASVQSVSNTTCGLAPFCNYGPFYWVDQGSARTFQFTYHLTNGSGNSATVTFNVVGPTNVSMTASPSNPVGVRQGTNGPLISLGQTTPSTAHGVDFTVSPLPSAVAQSLSGLMGPKGNYQLVQMVNSETITERTDNGVFSCVPKAFSNPTPVDNNYPYPSNQGSMTSSDSPSSGLYYSAMGAGYNLYELRRDFSVSMYLMFDPGIPAAGDPAQCYPAVAASDTARGISQCHGSIPVPLGSLSWSYTASGINTQNPATPLGNGTNWVVSQNCTLPASPSGFAASFAYPHWQTVNVNRNRSPVTFNCTAQN